MVSTPAAGWALQPTAEVPIVTPAMRTLFQLVHDDESMLSLCLHRKQMADDLEAAHADLPFRVDDSETTTKLVLPLPNTLTQSLIRHTLAYDILTRAKGLHTYPSEHKGVYAAAIAVQGRGGKFLSVDEIQKLISAIQDYRRGVKLWLNHGKKWKPTSTSDRKRRTAVKDIDSQLVRLPRSPSDISKPRFGQSKRGLVRLEQLCSMLEGFGEAAATHAFGTTLPLHQSPLMIGCSSVSMKARCRAHKYEYGGSFCNTTWTWEFALCVMASLGLEPEVVTVPILVTFERVDLKAAEMLVTTLAQSLITQTGFNIVEGGGQADDSPSHAVEEARELVYARMPWFRENIQRACQQMEHATTALRDWELSGQAWTDRMTERDKMMKTVQVGEAAKVDDWEPSDRGRDAPARD
ncbi:hypothetical protein QBC40DRAFT_260464 [Triangularia verruculosa]|uniref:Uncharacterized protein n=1 Tax=Triangularia verruculosa TaxID=2587418 RepID=A0AAN7AMA9_9PEZI|nr:hypothetical protein QBC40DRAFT_260464 [Triangularia verruculosa]